MLTRGRYLKVFIFLYSIIKGNKLLRTLKQNNVHLLLSSSYLSKSVNFFKHSIPSNFSSHKTNSPSALFLPSVFLTMAAVPPPPLVRPPLGIRGFASSDSRVVMTYACACFANVKVRVYSSGLYFTEAQPLSDDSIERPHPTVEVDWVGNRVHIEITCGCNAGCRFIREDGQSGLVEVFVRPPSAM